MLRLLNIIVLLYKKKFSLSQILLTVSIAIFILHLLVVSRVCNEFLIDSQFKLFVEFVE